MPSPFLETPGNLPGPISDSQGGGGGGGMERVLPKIFDRGVPRRFSNPDPI